MPTARTFRPATRRGMTLALTLLLVALVSLALARQSLRISTTRISARAQSFGLESRWAAEGIADQWLRRGQDPDVDLDALLGAHHWRVDGLQIQVSATAAESKVSLRHVDSERWLALWKRQRSTLSLRSNPQSALVESSYTAVECLLGPDCLSGQRAYLAPPESVAPADVLTVWGEGKVDLNRASRDVLTATLEGFTDAQISTILRLRREQPLDGLSPVGQALSLTESQRETLAAVAIFRPRFIQLVVIIERGKMRAVYHAVVDVGESGEVLEVRLIP